MAGYLCSRISGGFLDYVAVVTLYPQFKSDIDACLIARGFGHLIIEEEN